MPLAHPRRTRGQIAYADYLMAQDFGLDFVSGASKDEAGRAWLLGVRNAEAATDSFGYIYRITNKATGQAYVGQTKRSLATRLRDHIAAGVKAGLSAENMESAYPLHQAMAESGGDFSKFSVKVLAVGFYHETAREWLNEREVELIAGNKSHVKQGGYNLVSGGAGTRDMSEESALKRDQRMATVRHGPQSSWLQPLAMKLLAKGSGVREVSATFGLSTGYVYKLRKRAENLTEEEQKLTQADRFVLPYVKELRKKKTTVIGMDLTGAGRRGVYARGAYLVSPEMLIGLNLMRDVPGGPVKLQSRGAAETVLGKLAQATEEAGIALDGDALALAFKAVVPGGSLVIARRGGVLTYGVAAFSKLWVAGTGAAALNSRNLGGAGKAGYADVGPGDLALTRGLAYEADATVLMLEQVMRGQAVSRISRAEYDACFEAARRESSHGVPRFPYMAEALKPEQPELGSVAVRSCKGSGLGR